MALSNVKWSGMGVYCPDVNHLFIYLYGHYYIFHDNCVDKYAQRTFISAFLLFKKFIASNDRLMKFCALTLKRSRANAIYVALQTYQFSIIKKKKKEMIKNANNIENNTQSETRIVLKRSLKTPEYRRVVFENILHNSISVE